MKKRDVLVLAAVLVAAGAIIALFVFARQNDLAFTITFTDPNSIAAKHGVYYNGAKIGEVTRVSSSGVDVRIDRDYETKIHRKLAFFVERDSLLGSGRRLVAYDCMSTTAGDPIRRGDVVEGNESTMTWLACRAAERTGLLGGAVATLASGLSETGPGRAIAETVREYSETVRQMGDQQWETFKREQLPALRRQAEAYKEQLEKEGKLEEARRFWADFLKWVESLRSEPVERSR